MEDALFFMSKASALRFHQSNGSTARAEPPRRSGNTHGFCVTGGLPPIASEPTPSPRLWTTPPGATPAKLCEHYHRAWKLGPKTGTFYFGGIRNFLVWSDTSAKRLISSNSPGRTQRAGANENTEQNECSAGTLDFCGYLRLFQHAGQEKQLAVVTAPMAAGLPAPHAQTPNCECGRSAPSWYATMARSSPQC